MSVKGKLLGSCINNFIWFAFLAGIFLGLTGLTLTWKMYAKDITDPARPTFCFDQKGSCAGKGNHLYTIEFDEINEKGDLIQKNWSLIYDPKNDEGSDELNQLTYGVLPEGYKEQFPAKKLKLNTYYSVNLINFFKIYKEDGKYKIEIINGTLDKELINKVFPPQ